jgi:hypothetical protein
MPKEQNSDVKKKDYFRVLRWEEKGSRKIVGTVKVYKQDNHGIVVRFLAHVSDLSLPQSVRT